MSTTNVTAQYSERQQVAIVQISERLQTGIRNGAEITSLLETVSRIAVQNDLPLQDACELLDACTPRNLSRITVLGIFCAEYIGRQA